MTKQSTTTAGTASPARDEEQAAALVARATKLVPLIREHAAKGAAAGQVSSEVVDALEAEGLFKLLVPKRLGGQEASVRTTVDVLAEISRGDGATGWIASLLNAGTWFGTTFSEDAQNDVFGPNPDSRISAIFTPGSSARRVDGGYVVSGRWPWASGGFAANWAALGLALDVAQGEDPRGIALFSRDQYTIEQSWFVTGMKGTASNTIVMNEQFVPDHRIQPFANMRDADYLTPHVNVERNSRLAFIPVAALVLIAPQLGLARHALELTLQKLPRKAVAYTRYTEARNSPAHHAGVAQAATKVRLAELLARQAAEIIDYSADRAEMPSITSRAQIRNDVGAVAELCKDAIDALLTANGASSFGDSSVLARVWLDSEIAARHAYVTPDVGREVYGRVLLGADDPITMDV